MNNTLDTIIAEMRAARGELSRDDYDMRVAYWIDRLATLRLSAVEAAPGVEGDAVMTDAEVLQWIDACNSGKARNTLRHCLAIRRLSTPAAAPAPAGKAKARTCDICEAPLGSDAHDDADLCTVCAMNEELQREMDRDH